MNSGKVAYGHRRFGDSDIFRIGTMTGGSAPIPSVGGGDHCSSRWLHFGCDGMSTSTVAKYCVCVFLGLPILLIGALLLTEYWERMAGMLIAWDFGQWSTVLGDEFTAFGGIALLIGGLMLFVGIRGMSMYDQSSDRER